MKKLKLLHFKNKPIFEQLQIEEALLRTDTQNWCLINEGSPPAIVMGISGDVKKLVHLENYNRNPVPLIKRFSGGGTVVVDHETLFVSFIFNSKEFPFPAFPEPIMRWSADFYKEAWQIEGFDLRENDYVIHDKKCGGNAQYIKKNRWVHHTTFLWDFCEERMSLLTLPEKRPSYREARSHSDFLTPLKKTTDSKESMVQNIKNRLLKSFDLEAFEESQLSPLLSKAHRQSTLLLS